MPQEKFLIFIDDDAIVIDKKAFSNVYNLSCKFDYGYGAKRL